MGCILLGWDVFAFLCFGVMMESSVFVIRGHLHTYIHITMVSRVAFMKVNNNDKYSFLWLLR